MNQRVLLKEFDRRNSFEINRKLSDIRTIPAAAHKDILVVGGHGDDMRVWAESGYGYLSYY